MKHLLLALLALACVGGAWAEGGPWDAKSGEGYAETFGMTHNPGTLVFGVQYVSCTVPANVLWPGDAPSFTFQVYNNQQDKPLATAATVQLIQYAINASPNRIGFGYKCTSTATSCPRAGAPTSCPSISAASTCAATASGAASPRCSRRCTAPA